MVPLCCKRAQDHGSADDQRECRLPFLTRSPQSGLSPSRPGSRSVFCCVCYNRTTVGADSGAEFSCMVVLRTPKIGLGTM